MIVVSYDRIIQDPVNDFLVKILSNSCQILAFFYSSLTERNKQRYAQPVFTPDRQLSAHFIHEYPCDIQT